MTKIILFCLFFLLGQTCVYGQEKTNGIIESLEEILKTHGDEFKQLLSSTERRPLFSTTLASNIELTIHPLVLRSIILHSSNSYLQVIGSDECLFFAFLENNLLRSAEGYVRNLVVEYQVDNHSHQMVINKDDFIQHIYKTKCFANKETRLLYLEDNLYKTLEKSNFNPPTTEQNCNEIFKGWRQNSHLPYLCKIPETIRLAQQAKSIIDEKHRPFYETAIVEGNRYRQKIPFFKRVYLNNLCSNLSDQKKFCSKYVTDDVWSRVISGELPSYIMNYKCSNMLKKQKLTDGDLANCRSKFIDDPASCHTGGADDLPSLIPRPNCQAISKALDVAHLRSDYQDCPGNMDNEGITNIHRLIMHLAPRPIESTSASCAYEANYSFAKLNMDYSNEKAWPLKICYQNPASEQETCDSYIPGHNEQNDLSETHVVAKILNKIINAPNNLKCSFVSNDEYRPALLKYKNGCFIVYDINECTTFHCPRKLYYRNRLIEKLTFKGLSTFDYFVNTHQTAKYSAHNILSETFKITGRSVMNLTEAVAYLDRASNNIIHGVGCAENLLPFYFKSTALNACRPLPFIIDGHTNGQLVVRTAIDDIHSPRLMNWNNIYSAIANYKNLHPLQSWTLYGLK